MLNKLWSFVKYLEYLIAVLTARVSLLIGKTPLLFATLADVAAAPGPALPIFAFVVEVGSTYVWVPGDTSVQDGVVVIANTGGTSGRWIHQGDSLYLKPVGGLGDDALHVLAAIAPAAAGKRRIVLQESPDTGSVFQWRSVQSTPPLGTHIVMEAGTAIHSTVAPSVNLEGVFVSAPSLKSPASVLASPVVIGSNQFSVTKPFAVAVGDLFRSDELNQKHRVSIYRVIAVNDAGPTVIITVDRPILYVYLAGDPAENVICPENIILEGNGAQITGTGTHVINLTGAIDCRVSDFDLTNIAGFTASAFTFGDGSFNSTARGINADATAAATCAQGLGFESCEQCLFESCIANRFTAQNVLVRDSFNCTVRNVAGTGSPIGCILTSNHTPNQGSNTCLIDDCDFDANTVGVWVSVGSSENVVRATTARGCTTWGFAVSGGASPMIANVFEDCIGDGSGKGFFLDTLSQRTRINAVTASACGRGIDLGAGGTTNTVNGATLDGCTTNALAIAQANAIVRNVDITFTAAGLDAILLSLGKGIVLDGLQLTMGAVTGIHAIDAAIEARITNTRASIAGAGTVSIQDSGGAGVLYIDNCDFDGAAAAGPVVGAGKTLRLGDHVDLDDLGTPIFVNAAGFVNRPAGTTHNDVTLAGATAIAWPDFKTTDDVELSLLTLGGTGIGLQPRLTKTPGTGFTLTPPAGDTSTWSYVVR